MSRIRVVGGAILDGAGQVLAAQRGRGRSHEGLWELPGGKVEPGERDQDALVRELQEELRVTVAVGSRLGISRWRRVELIAFACTLLEGEPVATEHHELRWVDADEIGRLTWTPADIPLLQPLGARLRRDRG